MLRSDIGSLGSASDGSDREVAASAANASAGLKLTVMWRERPAEDFVEALAELAVELMQEVVS
ncbi:MAG: hypothetical protein AB7I04_25315 [Pseudomonadales bacterium]